MPTPRSRSRSSNKRRPLANFDLPSTSTQLRHGVKAACRTRAPRLTTPRTATSLNSTLAPQPTFHSRVSVGLNLLSAVCRAVISTAVCHIRVPANSPSSRSMLLPAQTTPLMRRGLAPRRSPSTLAQLTLPTLLLSRTKPPAWHCCPYDVVSATTFDSRRLCCRPTRPRSYDQLHSLSVASLPGAG